MIIPGDAEKVFDKIQLPFMSPGESRNIRDISQQNKNNIQQTHFYIMPNGETLPAFSLKPKPRE